MAEERYFYIEPGSISDRHFILNRTESHHLTQVLRLPVESKIWLLDGVGNAYRAKINSINRNNIEGEILEEYYSYGESPVQFHLAFGIIKRDRMGLLLEKGTELGVRSFQPLVLDRSIKRNVNLSRGEKIITAAAKQCGRSYFPRLNQPCTLADWLKITSRNNRFFCQPSKTESLSNFFDGLKSDSEICFLIGPEGDFSPRELALLERNRLVALSLGPRRLRSETAGLATLAILNELFQNRGGLSHG